jgi:hypothetical protein
MTTPGPEWGPLAGLAGIWEGDEGLDEAFNNDRAEVVVTPFRERTEFKPFGPVENGKQTLYGLDYRTAAWRADEENPFHTEVGYWLWDADDGQVMRCFVIPRGSVILAGGTALATDTVFTMKAECGSEVYGIVSNAFLAKAARATAFEVIITVGDGVFSYEETTTIEHVRYPHVLLHTDRNTLRRVSD